MQRAIACTAELVSGARFLVGASEHCGSEGFGATHFRVGAPPRLLGRQFIRNSVKRLEHFVFQRKATNVFLGGDFGSGAAYTAS
jgi:hypothetical protein